MFSSYIWGVITVCMYTSIIVVGLAVFTGFTGLVSLGHAAFVAIGAYTCAILTKTFELPFFVGVIGAALTSGLASLIIGYPTLRAKLRSDYFTITTLGFGEAMRVILENLEITNGARGIGGLGNYSHPITVFVILVIVLWVTKNYIFSRYGRMSISVREDPIAAEMAGINVVQVRLRALLFSAICAGIGGAIYAHYIRFIQPSMFISTQSTLYTAIVVAGGMGSITGPCIAACIFTMIPEVLRVADQWRMVAYGAVLVAIMVLRPSGIFGYKEITIRGMRNLVRRLRKQKLIGPEGGEIDE
jgi:branched-chain amino acid transport system permease protein